MNDNGALELFSMLKDGMHNTIKETTKEGLKLLPAVVTSVSESNNQVTVLLVGSDGNDPTQYMDIPNVSGVIPSVDDTVWVAYMYSLDNAFVIYVGDQFDISKPRFEQPIEYYYDTSADDWQELLRKKFEYNISKFNHKEGFYIDRGGWKGVTFGYTFIIDNTANYSTTQMYGCFVSNKGKRYFVNLNGTTYTYHSIGGRITEFDTRQTSANLTQDGVTGMSHFLATGSMTTGKPKNDSHLIHFAWDGTNGFDAELAVSNNSTAPWLAMRSQSSGTWDSTWHYAPVTQGTATATDFNNIKELGWWWINPNTTTSNRPVNTYGILSVDSSNNNTTYRQHFVTYDTGRSFVRVYANSQWYEWKESQEVLTNYNNTTQLQGTIASIGLLGTSLGWYNTSYTGSAKPTDYGFCQSFTTGGTEVHQLWMEQNNGALYHRGMNGGSTPSNVAWKKIFDDGMIIPVANGGTGLNSLNTFVRTTGAQTVGGQKTFTSYPIVKGGTIGNYPSVLFTGAINDSELGRVGIETDGTNGNPTRVFARVYSYNSSTYAPLSYYDAYRLPTVSAGKTGNNFYDILTSRSAVTVAQGGTGATTAASARTNLGIGLTQLYSGTLTSGSVTLTNGATYKMLLVCGQNNASSSWSSVVVPTVLLSSTATRFQISDDVNYVNFNLTTSGNNVTFAINARSAEGLIRRIYGVN